MSVVSTGPFTINNKDSVKVAFAVLAGDDLNDLKNSSINAQVKYDNMVTAIPTITGADGFSLKQNYPNPVNTSKTIIEFNLPTKSQAEVTIYNSLGQKVMNVLNTTQLEAGPHQLNVDLSDFSNGLYFYELKAGNNAAMMKMIVQH